MTPPRLSPAALALALVPLLACAHAPVPRAALETHATEPAARSDDGAAPKRERVLVTGSRLPQYVDPRTGRPVPASPVQIFTREDLLRTGVPADLGAALHRLEPTFR